MANPPILPHLRHEIHWVEDGKGCFVRKPTKHEAMRAMEHLKLLDDRWDYQYRDRQEALESLQ